MLTVIIAVLVIFLIYPFKKDCAPLRLRKSLIKGTKTGFKKLVALPNQFSGLVFSGIEDDKTKKLATRISTGVLWVIIIAIVFFNLDNIADLILRILS